MLVSQDPASATCTLKYAGTCVSYISFGKSFYFTIKEQLLEYNCSWLQFPVHVDIKIVSVFNAVSYEGLKFVSVDSLKHLMIFCTVIKPRNL